MYSNNYYESPKDIAEHVGRMLGLSVGEVSALSWLARKELVWLREKVEGALRTTEQLRQRRVDHLRSGVLTMLRAKRLLE